MTDSQFYAVTFIDFPTAVLSSDNPHKESQNDFDGVPYLEVKRLILYFMSDYNPLTFFSIFRGIPTIHNSESSQTFIPVLAILQNLQL